MLSTALTLAALVSLANDGGAAPSPAHGIGILRDGGTGTVRKPGAPKPAPAAEVQGSLSKDVITKVLKRHGNEVRSCYEQALRVRPELAGKIAVKFIVGATGDVLQAEIASDTLGDESFKACMLNVVRSWKFPEPQGGGNVTITYPWVFQPNAPESK